MEYFYKKFEIVYGQDNALQGQSIDIFAIDTSID